MSEVAHRAAGGAVALLVTAAVVGLSRAPYPGRGDSALLRLSWRVRGEQVEQDCRKPTADELERLPTHMRNPDACVGELVPYRLTVRVDGESRVDEQLEGAGARGDRPIYVFRELELRPGEHRVQVSFLREDASETGALSLILDETLELRATEVALVTASGTDGGLVVRRGP